MSNMKSTVFLRDDIAAFLNSAQRARPDLAEAFDLVRIYIHVEPTTDVDGHLQWKLPETSRKGSQR